MDAKLQFLSLSNTWTMPVQNRLDMELTGINRFERYFCSFRINKNVGIENSASTS
jgi:hypothetical protein